MIKKRIISMGAFHDWESAFLYLKGRVESMKTFFYRLIHWVSIIDFLNWFRKDAGERPREARRGAGYARYTIA